MDFFFTDKKVPAQLTRSTRNLIQTIGQTKQKSKQQEIINKQIAMVKELITTQLEEDELPDILIRLIYFQTLGYDTSFAHILPINLCQSQNLYIKKIAYLLAAMLVKPGDQLNLLMNNTLSKDLNCQNLFTIMIALTMIRYFLTYDSVQIFLSPVLKLLKNPTSMVRKKAYLVIFNMYQFNKNFVPNIKILALQALKDPDAPVVFAGVYIFKMLIFSNAHQYKDVTKALCEIQMKIVDHRYPNEYDYHRIPAPWYQIHILQMLELLGKNDQQTSSLMYDVLDKTVRRCVTFSMHFNKAILQQAIKTISNIYPHKYLIQQCENSLYKFFDGDNSNMRYFGICCLTQLIKNNRQCMDRWQVVLLDCLQSSDVTLAEKTIGLLTQIANQQNSELILNRIISLTQKSTDQIQKRKLIKRGIILIERFSADRQIFLRRMNEIFYKFQSLISDTSVNNYLKVLLEIVDLEPNFLDLALPTYIEIIQNFRNNVLVKVSSWIIGQFTHKAYQVHKDVQAVDRSVNAILNCSLQYLNDQEITFMLVSSLMKLSQVGMTTKHEQIKQYLLKVQGSYNYFSHKCGQEFIRMAKYSKTLTNSHQLMHDPKMSFLYKYVNNQREMDFNKKFIISKVKQNKKTHYDLLANDQDQQNSMNQNQNTNQNINSNQSTINLFEFKPGNRWGGNNNHANITSSTNSPKKLTKSESINKTDQQLKQTYKQAKKQLTLRGPHQGKKPKNGVDLKKQKLAKSLFGKKNQFIKKQSLK